jgi:hypothetical protein
MVCTYRERLGIIALLRALAREGSFAVFIDTVIDELGKLTNDEAEVESIAKDLASVSSTCDFILSLPGRDTSIIIASPLVLKPEQRATILNIYHILTLDGVPITYCGDGFCHLERLAGVEETLRAIMDALVRRFLREALKVGSASVAYAIYVLAKYNGLVVKPIWHYALDSYREFVYSIPEVGVFVRYTLPSRSWSLAPPLKEYQEGAKACLTKPRD